MTNEHLVMRIKAGEDVAENMVQLYDQVKDFIRSIAWRYRESGELEDLEQEGYLALYPAIEGFDPAAGCKFLTYAEKWIRQRIKRYIQNNGSCLRIPVQRLETIRQYEKFVSSYAAEYGRKPSDWRLAVNLGCSMEQVKRIREDASRARLGSLDSPVTGLDGWEDATAGEFVADPFDLEAEVIDRMEGDELRRILWECVDSLPGQQPEVIRKRYKGGMTLAEIGRQQGATPETVRQVHAKALRELRKPRYCKRLRPFLPEAERIYSKALAGGGVERFQQTWTSSTERAALWLIESGEDILWKGRR